MRELLGVLVGIAVVATGSLIATNCNAPDAAQGLMLIGIPTIVGLCGGWIARQLTPGKRGGRWPTMVASAFGTGIATLVWILVLWIGHCE